MNLSTLTARHLRLMNCMTFSFAGCVWRTIRGVTCSVSRLQSSAPLDRREDRIEML